MQPTQHPVALTERAAILDILRGIALFGICLANYPILSQYVFQRQEVKDAMSTAALDQWIPYFHFALIDGKFYSLFSLLFGIGFSVILLRNRAKGKSGLGYFYRRLFILALIGLAHAFLIWNGDILFLYALIGMLLPLFRNVTDKALVVTWAVLIFSPILIDLLKGLANYNPGNFFFNRAIATGTKYGITEENFGTWLSVKTEYSDVLKFNHSGFFWRWEGLINSNRLPKVLGMFLLGLYVGRKMIYAKLEEHIPLLKKVQKWGFIIGLPFSIGHAYVELNRLPDGPIGLLHPVFYALNVVPLSLAYTATICLWFLKPGGRKRLNIFAAPGRMALTNYIMQSCFAILIFYGVGLGFGGRTPLTYVIVIAILVYTFQIMFSHFWLRYFNYGPIEWIWRQLTYGKRLKLRRVVESS